MSESLPQVYLVRHGQTEWSVSGRHTGRSDIPLTSTGEEQARRMGKRLAGESFSRIFSSPSQRARRTCELSGFAAAAEVDPDLAEWDYGDYEGLLSAEIHARDPHWMIFRDGCPHGESAADITARADRVVARLRAKQDNALLFSSGHFLRALAARWCGLEITFGRFLLINTATLGILSYEHTLDNPGIAQWNEQPR